MAGDCVGRQEAVRHSAAVFVSEAAELHLAIAEALTDEIPPTAAAPPARSHVVSYLMDSHGSSWHSSKVCIKHNLWLCFVWLPH